MKTKFFDFRKTLSIILCIAIVAVLVPTSLVFAEEAGNGAWKGSVAEPINGSGTESDPTLISTAEELAYVVANGGSGKHYKITKDIYLNDVTKIDWTDGTVASGYSVNNWYTSADSAVFEGTIDGDGHVIYGLYVNTTEKVNSGLLPRVNGAAAITVKNLGIEASFVSTAARVSAIVCDANGTGGTLNISQCYVGENVTLKGDRAAAIYCYGGGIAYKIDKCYSLASVAGTGKDGMVAETWGGSREIRDSFIVNAGITDHGTIGCFNTYATDITGSNNSAIQLTTDKMQGRNVFTASDKMTRMAGCDAYLATGSYPILKIFVKAEEGIWNGTETAPTKGSGSESDPILITSAEELAYVVAKGSNGNYYKLTKDIYLNDVEKVNWTSGKADCDYRIRYWYTSSDSALFSGTIDGDGHVIYGLYTNTTENVASALLPNVNGTAANVVKNLGIEAAYISVGGDASAFVGDSTNYGGSLTFYQCYAGEDVTVNGNRAAVFYAWGGIGYTIDRCYSLAAVAGATKQGLTAETWTNPRSVTNSYVVDTAITGHGSIGCTDVYATNGTGALSNSARLLTADKMQGKDVLTASDKMPRLSTCGAFVATEGYPVLKIFELAKIKESEITVWNGEANEPVGGSGTEDDPYQIFTAEELAYVIEKGSSSKYYKIVRDIYLNDVSKVDWSNGIVSDGYDVNGWYTSENSGLFDGTLDGNGHVIYGLYVNTEDSESSALLPRIQGNNVTEIKNLGIEASYISTGKNASAVVCDSNNYNGSVSFNQCYVGEDVVIKGAERSAVLFCWGGITFSIDKCYSLATVEESEWHGAVANVWVQNCTVSNTYIVNTRLSGQFDAVCTNVYATHDKGGATKLTVDNMKGIGALTASVKMPGLAECNAFTATASYPVLTIFGYTPDKFTITFNANGGVVAVESIEAVAGAVIEFPVPSKSGYTFKAWYEDEAYTTLAGNVMPAEDATYYAKWFIKYDVNNDGAVNANDLTKLITAVLTENFNEAADFSLDGARCNDDDKINLLDLVRLKKVLAGSYTDFLPEGYRLVWSEEFSGNGYTDTWGTTPISPLYIENSEDKISVADGKAVMSLTYDSVNNKYIGAPSLTTAQTMNFKQGYIEVNAKMPYYAQGEWPALWLLSNTAGISKDVLNATQPDYDLEIDFGEGILEDARFASQIHLWGKDATVESINRVMTGNDTCVVGTLDGSNYYGFSDTAIANEYHRYGLLWTEDKLEFYLDGAIYCTYIIPEDLKESFDAYVNLIFSLNYYTPEFAEAKGIDAGTYFENHSGDLSMEIDYVRIYQSVDNGSILIK